MLDMIESQVFTQIKARMPTKIKTKYPDLNFTTSARSPTTPKFPTVYVHFMESPEAGITTENNEVEAVASSFQVEVSDNVNQNRATEVAREILKIMKSIGYHATTMPMNADTDSVHRNVARYRRTIGHEDVW